MNRKSCSSGNPNRAIMASHFLRALARINSATPLSSAMQRSRSIRRAAYVSMAYTAGTRRAWSRALLRRLRGQQARLRPPGSRSALVRRRTRISGSRPRELSQTDVLRSLVPGGKAMDLCSFLAETAHYVQCLSAQVTLMQAVVDSTMSA